MTDEFETTRLTVRDINLEINRRVDDHEDMSAASVAETVVAFRGRDRLDPEAKGEITAWVVTLAEVVLLMRFDPVARGDSPEKLIAHVEELEAYVKARQAAREAKNLQ
jgi:hypothetical protein